MILYFSGTGNSRFTALRLAHKLGDAEVVSINESMRSKKNSTYISERPFVFVAPTYAWRMPKAVENWIAQNHFEGSRGAYFVLTCGGSCGNAELYAKRLCESKGLRFLGLAGVVMPENYLALFPTPNKAESRAIIEKSKQATDALAEKILRGEAFEKAHVSLMERIESGPINPLFYSVFVHDKGFGVSDACVSCGKCAERCPLDNIEMKDGKPIWKGNCTHCMACIGGCPVEAINYKSNSKNRNRHYIADELIEFD